MVQWFGLCACGAWVTSSIPAERTVILYTMQKIKEMGIGYALSEMKLGRLSVLEFASESVTVTVHMSGPQDFDQNSWRIIQFCLLFY